MTDTSATDVTAILRAAQEGKTQDAAARLLPLVYDDLRKLAHAQMARLPPGQTLQPTALVHEAYLRLIGKQDLRLESRRHVFFAARAMRDILLEWARRKAGPSLGGGRRRVELREGLTANEPPPEEVLALDEALDDLEKEDPLKAQIAILRSFAGMSVAETARVLGPSQRTMQRH
jgi:RNA polymerase sigma factor (TIGR02999 family)